METAQGEGEEQRQKRTKTGEEEEKGVKRSTGEREEFAKMIKTRAQERAVESENPGEGVDISQFGVSKAIGQYTLDSPT